MLKFLGTLHFLFPCYLMYNLRKLKPPLIYHAVKDDLDRVIFLPLPTNWCDYECPISVRCLNKLPATFVLEKKKTSYVKKINIFVL